MITLLVTFIYFAGLLFLLDVRVHTLLTYFQQEEYEAGRFLATVAKMRLYDVVSGAAVLVLFVLGLVARQQELALLGAAIVFAGVAWRERKFKFKKPLVLTARILRLRLVVRPAIAVLALSVWLWWPLAVLVLQIVPLVIVAANALLAPAQERINQGYIEEARQKLADFEGLRIGVTGSFGKTSVKHILAQVLAIDGNVFYSRGSVNTVLGLTRHIRQRLQPSHKYFIAEMGAYQIGSIARLCRFAQPEVGIITAVGDAHLERFGGIEQVAEGKAELAAFVCEHGRLVVTTEDVLQHKPFRDLYERHREKFVVCGPSEAADVQILDSRLDQDGRALKLRVGKDGPLLDLVVPLLANYNAANIALVVGTVNAIAPSVLAFLPGFMPHLEQTPHRLQKKESVGAPLLLDDAYNANEVGFREAVAVLKTLADERGGKSVMVTPGIVELGATHDQVHRALGELSGKLCDAVYVVNPARIPSFLEGAKAGGKATITPVQRFSEAQAAISKLYRDPRDVILYENDLPDMLEEVRLL